MSLWKRIRQWFWRRLLRRWCSRRAAPRPRAASPNRVSPLRVSPLRALRPPLRRLSRPPAFRMIKRSRSPTRTPRANQPNPTLRTTSRNSTRNIRNTKRFRPIFRAVTTNLRKMSSKAFPRVPIRIWFSAIRITSRNTSTMAKPSMSANWSIAAMPPSPSVLPTKPTTSALSWTKAPSIRWAAPIRSRTASRASWCSGTRTFSTA